MIKYTGDVILSYVFEWHLILGKPINCIHLSTAKEISSAKENIGTPAIYYLLI